MTRLSGRVPETGTAIQGATVAIIDTQGVEDPSQWSVVAFDTTDANGEWSVSGLDASAVERYHAVAQYDEGSSFTNFESLPYLSTPADVFAPETAVTVNTPTPAVEVASAIPDSGVMRLTFDDADTQTGTALDVWGDNDGSLENITTGVSGANQTYDTAEAYDFDRSSGSQVIGDDAAFPSGDSPRSFAAWLYPTQAPGGMYAFSYGSNADNETWAIDAGDTFRVVGFLNDWDTGISPTTDVWQHVAATYDGTTVAFYVDGQEEASTTSFSYNTVLSDYRVGAFTDGGDNFDGQIDDPRLYDKGLTGSEVSNLRQTGRI